MNKWNSFPFCLLADFAELELKMYASLVRENKRASRLPARQRKRLYGKAKQPYTMIHDCIEVHDKVALKRARMVWPYGGML